jgi:catechol 2,3-dioxygenase-like lactoylglutathione lyase family enzyme
MMADHRDTPHPPGRILETILYADDLEAAERFYTGALGLAVDSRKAGVFVFFRLEGAMLLVFRADASLANESVPRHGAHGPGHLCFAVDEAELEGWKTKLTRAGISIEHEQRWPRGGRSFYFRDPAGNSLEMATPRIWGFSET